MGREVDERNGMGGGKREKRERCRGRGAGETKLEYREREKGIERGRGGDAMIERELERSKRVGKKRKGKKYRN